MAVARAPNLLLESANWFSTWLNDNLLGAVAGELAGFRPVGSLRELMEQVRGLQRHLAQNREAEVSDIPSDHLPVLKRALLEQRLDVARRTDELTGKTHATDLLDQLHSRVRVFDETLNEEELCRSVAAQVPTLSEFLTVQVLEQRLSHNLPARAFDEKFHILMAPGLFLTDLRSYRERIGQRGGSVLVGYMDVDDLKDLNTRLSEPTVDSSVFPKFLAAVESQLYGHGHAYRFGGDEYAILLPNMSTRLGIELLFELQERLASLDYTPHNVQTTVSIGVFCVSPDCFLTEDEALIVANKAKTRAKEEGKDCIVIADANVGQEISFELRSRR